MEGILNTTINRNELDIGKFGEAWWRFMTENFPDVAAELKRSDRWNELALDVEYESLELRQLLRKQYAKANPRPMTFVEICEWEHTSSFIIDHEIMEQVVLRFRA